MSSIENIKSKLSAFKKRYYERQLLVGTLLFLITGLSLFLVINGVEYRLWMSSSVRSVVFFTFLGLLFLLFIWWVSKPASLHLRLRRGMSDEVAVFEISRFFPEIKDKLINTLQLSRLSASDSALLRAAIDKKSKELGSISFIKAVDFSVGKRYALIAGALLLGLLLVSFIHPSIIRDGTHRMVHFDQEFTPAPPFEFRLYPEKLVAFRGEKFRLEVAIEGEVVPESVRLVGDRGLDVPLQRSSNHIFTYDFAYLQESFMFQLEAARYYSPLYEVVVRDRPDLIEMDILIKNPDYTGGKRREVSNTGDLTVLEGSHVTWQINTLSTDSMQFTLNDEVLPTSYNEKNQFFVEKNIKNDASYAIQLFNAYGKNASSISHRIEIIEDQKPIIEVEHFPDTIMYQWVTLAGNIVDDHGFSALRMHYQKEGEEEKSMPLDLAPRVRKQSFYASWNIDSLHLIPGERLEFYVSVSDNDRVNGAKTSRSRVFVMEIPDDKVINKIMDEKSQGVEDRMDKSKRDVEDINEKLKEIEEKLKAEQKFTWQEKKQINEVINDWEGLQEELNHLQKSHKNLQQANDQFHESSDRLRERNEQFQSLLDQLLNDENKALYEKLKKLLSEKNPSPDQVRQHVQDIQKNDQNLEKELDRAIELFKRLKMENALEQNLRKLEELSKRQHDLAEDHAELSDDKREEQERIKTGFQEFREQMDKVTQMNQELKKPQAIEDYEMDERLIQRDLNDIEQQMKDEDMHENASSENQDESPDENGFPQSPQDQNSPIQRKQQEAAQKMDALSQKLSNMQSGMQMEVMHANLHQLRDILDNLIKLSFSQEKLMKEMREVNQSDPRFLSLSQAQLKLKDDVKVIQDSLLSLAERVVQLSSFITREVSNINETMDEALTFLKGRNRNRALSSQQFAMTAMNNLALLLDDTMQQMQMAISEAMGNAKGKQPREGLPHLMQMQRKLGEQINELKNSEKEGRALSEELARLAAEQEMIRRQLERIKQAEEGKPGGHLVGEDLARAIQQMEQNETDLVNKRLTQQLINRQRTILTRMLKADKSQREQEEDEEREAESPSMFSREIPPQFEEYLRRKQKEIELLKTIPLELNLFYMKEVNDYFRRISIDLK